MVITIFYLDSCVKFTLSTIISTMKNDTILLDGHTGKVGPWAQDPYVGPGTLHLRPFTLDLTRDT